MSEPLLQAQDLYKSFGRRKVLRGVSFSVYPNTLVGVVGENGAGKSTLLRILAGELRPNRGDVFRQGAMGYCPQTVILNNALTVNQHLDYFQVLISLIQKGIDRGEFQPVEAETVAIAIAALYEGLALLWIVDPQAVQWEKVGEASLHMLLDGIKAMP